MCGGMEETMRETLKKLKADIILSALLCAVLGIVLLLWPEATIDLVCKILAVGLIIMGAVQITSYFTDRSIHPFAGALGLLLVLVGIWIFLRPGSIVSIVPIVIGVILCVHGIQDLKLSFETKENGYGNWWSMLIIAAVSLLFGVICIVNAFGMIKLALRFIGIALIYDGVSDLWIANRAIRAAKAAGETAKALDVEYKEVDD